MKMKMNNFIHNRKLKKYFSFICLFLFIIFVLVPFTVYGAEDNEDLKENEEIKNPFYDYRTDRAPQTSTTDSSSQDTSETQNKVIETQSKEETTTAPDKQVKEVIKIKDKRIEPSFYWQGLILAGNKYKIVLEFNNETHIMEIGDKLDGYQIINVDSNKITLSKDNYIYYLRMGRE
ncbi:MAG: hypothetical protein ACQEQD_09220 [Bacillota bacterium]